MSCDFLGGATPTTVDGVQFIPMTVALEVIDETGVRSNVSRSGVRLFPNNLCGYAF